MGQNKGLPEAYSPYIALNVVAANQRVSFVSSVSAIRKSIRDLTTTKTTSLTLTRLALHPFICIYTWQYNKLGRVMSMPLYQCSGSRNNV